MRKHHVLAVALTTALAAATVASYPAVAATATATATATAHGTSTKRDSARHLLAKLPVRAESHSGSYEPTKFTFWLDADHDGENTRTEVLRAASKKPVTENKNGSVKTGRWIFADGRVYTVASKLRVQHLVSLEEAWTSGAYKWSPRKRAAYANDLGYGASLILIPAHASRSKSVRGTTASGCSATRNFIAVKSRWGLTVDATEKKNLTRNLWKYCRSLSVQKPSKPDLAELVDQPTRTASSPSSTSTGASSGPSTGGSSPVASPAPATNAAPAPGSPRSSAPKPVPVPDPATCPSGVSTGPSMKDLFGSRQVAAGDSFVIGGLGSSVGVGATLPDPAAAPAAYFASRLERKVDPTGLATWTTVNGSVNGSTIHNGRTRDWAKLEPSHPDVVVLAYGMNDGTPSQFESGETYDGAMKDLCALIGEIRQSGAVPVLLTTPSPHTTRSDWDWLKKRNIKPVPEHTAVDTSSSVRDAWRPGYGVAPESTRHFAVNEGIRMVAAADDVDLINVEWFWLNAVATRGEDALFNVNQYVHPNLLGHQLSYHAAIDDWLQRRAW